jgi:predicted amino acid-binding ACT domain protein
LSIFVSKKIPTDTFVRFPDIIHDYYLNPQASTTQRFFSSKELIINAVGSDRLGIVSDMTKYVTDAGGNVGESQAAKLGSYFSLMMMVSVPEEKVDSLVDQLKSMADMNASVYVAAKDSKATSMSPKIGCTL